MADQYLQQLTEKTTAASTDRVPISDNGVSQLNWTSVDTLLKTAGGTKNWKQAVRAATTANITLSGEQSIDGVSVVSGDRVLVKDQSTGSENGVYVAASGAWTRATDFASGDTEGGSAVFVKEGTVGADTLWVCTNDKGSDTVGTDALTFAEFPGNPLTHERGGLEADVSAFAGLIKIDAGATSELKSEFAKTGAPTVSDDSSAGYTVGSRWIDTTNDKEYVALDVSVGAAVWTETTAGASGGETNTASNQGTDGVGVFDAKSGVDLQFRNVAPGSAKITVTLNGKDVDVDLGTVNLGDLTDVVITSVGENEVLAYDSASGNWINQTPAEAGLAAATHTHSAADVTSGTLAHERGGLEADVSAFAGLLKINAGTTSELKSEFAKTAAPTANDDSSAGYAVGSRWIDTTNDKEYVCLDASVAAAAWTETTQAGTNPALNDVSDVTISTPADNEILGFDSASGEWINQTASELGLSGSTPPFDDSSGIVHDTVDNTKILRLDAGSITTATTRVLTMPDRDLDFTALVVGTGLATADGTLHVHTASAGAVSANPNFDDLVVENGLGASPTVGITLLTGTSGLASLVFGNTSDNDAVRIQYDHSLDKLIFAIDDGVGEGMALTSNADLIIGSTGTLPDGTLHVFTASAGAVSAATAADDLVVENSGGGGITILTPAANVGAVYFGSPTAADRGRIVYDHTVDALSLTTTGGVNGNLTLDTDNNLILNNAASGPGTGAAGVWVQEIGTAPSTSPADEFQMYAADANGAGTAAPHFRTEAGNVIKLYQESALTVKDASTVDATYGSEEANVIANNRTRIEEIETRLQALGILA